MRSILALLGVTVTLAACGADGEPTAPAPKPEPTVGITVSGITVSGTARFGISVGRGAATPLARVPAPGV